MTASIRYRVDPRDVPAAKAARRLHLTLAEFERLLPELTARGFPTADPTTGMYDLDAIDAWRRARHPQADLTNTPAPRDARDVVMERLGTFLSG